MSATSKPLAVVLAIVGAAIAVFFVLLMVKGGFSMTSLFGVLIGAGLTGLQIHHLRNNEDDEDEEEDSEEW